MNNIPTITTNLLEGKILTGVLPPNKQLPIQYLLPPQLSNEQQQTELLDIESCIDDPSLAPLGIHIQERKERKGKKTKHNDNNNIGQVSIQHRQQQGSTNTNNGIIMLRRRGLDTQQLSIELNHLLSISTTLPSPPLSPNTTFINYLKLPTLHLVELDLSKNKLIHLPKEIQQLTSLKILNLTCNQLQSVPAEIYELKQLQVLSLSQNKIKTLPSELPDQLTNLTTLKIAANLIKQLPNNLQKWTELQQLQLGSVYGGNKLTSLPNTIIDLPALQELDVSNNQLKSLPSQFAIPTLKILNLSNNQLASIPKSISTCQAMKSLNLSKNHLASLPIDLANLKKLELFDISENLLCIMPEELLNKMDSALLITGNPLTRSIDDHHQDEYTKLLRQMTLRSVTRSSSAVLTPSSSASSSASSGSTFSTGATGYFDQCGPRGMGCLSPVPSSSLPVPPRKIIKEEEGEEEDDQDALIDHELSFHAQQLNINGSRPSTPIASSPRIQPATVYQPSPLQSPPILAAAATRVAVAQVEVEEQAGSTNEEEEQEEEQDNILNTFQSNLIQQQQQHQQSEQQYILVDFPRQLPLPTETKLLHSLKEIATRTLLSSSSSEEEELENIMPPHLNQDLQDGKTKTCSYCQGPFVHEWVTSVQVKSFGGHPAVVRRVRFCSTKCWTLCLPKEQSKSVVSVHK